MAPVCWNLRRAALCRLRRARPWGSVAGPWTEITEAHVHENIEPALRRAETWRKGAWRIDVEKIYESFYLVCWPSWWHWNEAARLPKWERSEWWTWLLSDGCLSEGTRSLGQTWSVLWMWFCEACHVDWQFVCFPHRTLNSCVPILVTLQGPAEWAQRHQQVFMELLMIYGAVTVSQTLSTALYVHDLVGPFTCPRGNCRCHSWAGVVSHSRRCRWWGQS